MSQIEVDDAVASILGGKAVSIVSHIVDCMRSELIVFSGQYAVFDDIIIDRMDSEPESLRAVASIFCVHIIPVHTLLGEWFIDVERVAVPLADFGIEGVGIGWEDMEVERDDTVA